MSVPHCLPATWLIATKMLGAAVHYKDSDNLDDTTRAERYCMNKHLLYSASKNAPHSRAKAKMTYALNRQRARPIAIHIQINFHPRCSE